VAEQLLDSQGLISMKLKISRGLVFGFHGLISAPVTLISITDIHEN
jgi:hypothetical protein